VEVELTAGVLGESEDWEEGNRILDALREIDVEEQVEQGKK